MLDAAFFARFGMFVDRRFLDEETCARIRRAARRAPALQAVVWKDGGRAVDEEARRATHARVPKTIETLVERRLRALKPRLERHFGLRLRGAQRPQFLIYRSGDFFECHTDGDSDGDSPQTFTSRRVSVVVFLNAEGRGGEPETSSGGSLTFPRLIDESRLGGYGFPVRGEPGLLIAFRSDVPHAVSPVVRGERYTVVSWFV